MGRNVNSQSDSAYRGSNHASIKLANRGLILRLIQKGGTSRASLAEQSCLSRGGMTPIINELIQQRLVVECESKGTSSGRPPIILRLNSQYVKVVSVQWIRDQVIVALVGVDGCIQESWQYAYIGTESADDIVDMIIEQISRILLHEIGNLLLGIIVQAPGPLDAINGVILNPSNFHNWQNIPIVDILSAHFNLPVRLENNLVGYTVAEQHFGYGRDIKHFIYMVVDDGIGAGFVLNGQLYQGKSRQISEVGHISLNIHGPRCSCGNYGCAEMYASVPAMCHLGLGISVNQPVQDWKMHLHELVRRYSLGDPACQSAIEHEVEYLGNLIVTLINTFDIDTVVIGSMLTIAQAQLHEPLHRYVSEHIVGKSLLNPRIFFSQIQQPSIVGGALHMFNLFTDERLGSYEELIARNECLISRPAAELANV